MEFSEMSKHYSNENADNPLGLKSVKVKRNRKRKSTYHCKICHKVFRNESSCIAHTNLHQNRIAKYGVTSLRTFRCHSCGTCHKGLSAFLAHQSLHEDVKQINEQFEFITDQNDRPAEEVIITTDGNLHLVSATQQVTDENTAEEQQTVDVHGNDNGVFSAVNNVLRTAAGLGPENISTIPLTAVSLMPALVSASSQSSTQANVNNPSSTANMGANCKTVASNDGVHIEIPNQVKAIYLNTPTHNLSDITKQLDSLHQKLDVVIKHLNIPFDEDGNPVPLPQTTMEVQRHQASKSSLNNSDETNTTVILSENFPPSYSVVQAVKEQHQQEYYALTLAGRQSQQAFKNESTHILSSSPELKNYVKGKTIDLWATQQTYITPMSSLTDQPEHDEEVEVANPIIPNHTVDKIFVESRSRANFAKNLTFSIFTQEERHGKNCTGRVFGKAQHKGQLDTVKLLAVKEATFRKYPCRADLIDITWRKECITAIDSGLRNENRSVKALTSQVHHHHHQLVEPVVSSEGMTNI